MRQEAARVKLVYDQLLQRQRRLQAEQLDLGHQITNADNQLRALGEIVNWQAPTLLPD